MKNIIAIVNFDMGTHAMRYIKHFEKPVNRFHLDVKNYGINPTDNILDNLDTDIVHMVLSSNPLTAFKLYSKYPDHVSFCLMDEDCNYTEIENPNVNEVIKLSCGFDMPLDLNSDLDFFDCSVATYKNVVVENLNGIYKAMQLKRLGIVTGKQIRKSTRLNSSHEIPSRMPSSA